MSLLTLAARAASPVFPPSLTGDNVFTGHNSFSKPISGSGGGLTGAFNQSAVYLDPVIGNDATGGLGPLKPFKTFDAAIAVATGDLFITGSNSTEFGNTPLANGINLYGVGNAVIYAPNAWETDGTNSVNGITFYIGGWAQNGHLTVKNCLFSSLPFLVGDIFIQSGGLTVARNCSFYTDYDWWNGGQGAVAYFYNCDCHSYKVTNGSNTGGGALCQPDCGYLSLMGCNIETTGHGNLNYNVLLQTPFTGSVEISGTRLASFSSLSTAHSIWYDVSLARNTNVWVWGSDFATNTIFQGKVNQITGVGTNVVPSP